jgi:NAD(P)-dependent dehydrogenase (short-subunit alcohol dehydrogenase family)
MVDISKLIDLKDRYVLITGASGSLGISIANTLAKLGANLILTDLEESDLEVLKQQIRKKYDVNIFYKPCNLEMQEERIAFIDWVNNNFNELNILINNAAFVGSLNLTGWAEKFENQSIETWRRAIEVNLTASFELCQKLSPLMVKSKGASIINVGSIYGVYGPDWRLYENTTMANPAAYAASKGGLIQITKWLSTTLAPKIRVNAISPGGILRGQPIDFVRKYEDKIPLKRMASENDICGAIAFFASDLSAYVTGQNLMVDGGLGVW